MTKIGDFFLLIIEIRGSIDIESTKVVSFVKKKGNGQKYENIQVDANEDLKNDITNDTTQKESQEEPKILLKVKDQQCLQEQISKERSQESKVAKEDFPMKMSDSPYDPRVGLKKEIEEKLKGTHFVHNYKEKKYYFSPLLRYLAKENQFSKFHFM